MPFVLELLTPLENSVRSHLGTVVTADHVRIAASLGDGVQFPGDTDAGDRVVDDLR